MEKIRESLQQTRLYLVIYKYLNDQISSYQFKIAPNFFTTASDATLRETILGITRLTDDDPESINFKLLLNMAGNHPRILQNSSIDPRTLVETNRLRLANLDPLLKALRPVRDRELAHLDRKHVNDPSAVFPQSIQVQELAQCVDILTDILSDLWQALHGVPLEAHHEDDLIVKELESLWIIIEQSSEMAGHVV